MNSVVFISRALEKNVRNRLVQSQRIAGFSIKEAELPAPPKNMIKDLNNSSMQSDMGAMYDKKPFKLRLQAGKRYGWCSCGKSRNQPLCDGTHKSIFLKIKLKPVHFVVDETKEYWLCNCKQTSNRPFCDGTHKRPDIQEAVKH